MKMIKIKTAANFRKEVSVLLSKKTTEILTENYNYKTRDGPSGQIEQFRNQLQGRISSSIYTRLEYLLEKGFRIEGLENMLKAAKDEKKAIVEWANNKAKILWPLFLKVKKETGNENNTSIGPSNNRRRKTPSQ